VQVLECDGVIANEIPVRFWSETMTGAMDVTTPGDKLLEALDPGVPGFQ